MKGQIEAVVQNGHGRARTRRWPRDGSSTQNEWAAAGDAAQADSEGLVALHTQPHEPVQVVRGQLARAQHVIPKRCLLRVFCNKIVNHSYFTNSVLVCILVSSAMLAAEDPLEANSRRNTVRDGSPSSWTPNSKNWLASDTQLLRLLLHHRFHHWDHAEGAVESSANLKYFGIVSRMRSSEQVCSGSRIRSGIP